MEKTFNLTYKCYGDRAILVEWPAVIAEDVLRDIINFKAEIVKAYNTETVEINNAYHSILLVYSSTRDFNFETEVLRLKEIYGKHKNNEVSIKPTTLWKIPVCYEDSFAIDLQAMALEKQMTKVDIIKRHTEALYTIYFIGFLPGFLYLGGLDKTLHTPRKATPKSQIKTGSVAIGGEQTGIYPSDSPGGWHIIGNSPICFFDASKIEPCFVKPGDKIQFYAVSLKKYKDIKILVDGGVYQMEGEVFHD